MDERNCDERKLEEQKKEAEIREQNNCDRLFEYLRSILYDSDISSLDTSCLDEPYQKLGMGLQFLENAVREMKEYSEALSKGRLSAKVPGRDNFLCENLKNIHANLNHLTWQAKQVAKGDYSQTVSFLGEFSEAFNTMTRQLKEREESLKHEAKREKTHANMMESYNQLLMELIARSDEEVMVISMLEHKVLYCNENISIQLSPEEIYQLCLKQQAKQADDILKQNDTYEWNWEVEDGNHHYFKITTGVMLWQGQKAYAHIIREITEEKEKQSRLEKEAYRDPLTGVGNRYFFFEKAEELLAGEEGIILCYCDLDNLKYVNDNFGHSEGDWYIRYFADTVRWHIRKEDIFARIGGDEFCIILRHCPMEKARRKMKRIQKMFSSEREHPYRKSFSFGLEEIPGDHGQLQMEEVINHADEAMYRQKRVHKEARRMKNLKKS